MDRLELTNRYGGYLITDLDDYKVPEENKTYIRPELTDEQKLFISKAIDEKRNVLVDACVGSGKTTSIQALCDAYPADTKILYLTYSKLLKLDARAKIKKNGVTVTNYHGFAYMMLKKYGLSSGLSELVQTVLNHPDIKMPHYDVMVIDEYQDLELETAKLIQRIKDDNPDMQLIAVGDMKQKIQDKTTLKVREFIDEFLGDHIELEFTKCFRLCAPHAQKLSEIWEKKITGVNNNCKVAIMKQGQVTEFLGKQNPGDVLCLGARTGTMARVLNDLEELYPEKYNKQTIYASIRDKEGGSTEPKPTSGIFTTYDGSKGLERKICVLFDFTPSYWTSRAHQADADPEILRNIFMVAASRGKNLIIFAEGKEEIMDDSYIRENMNGGKSYDTFSISEMFDFKYREEVEKCYSMLDVNRIPVSDNSVIPIRKNDGLIDLTPCIGMYQEAAYFDGYDIDKAFLLLQETKPDLHIHWSPDASLDKKILQYTALETAQSRYDKQVQVPFVDEEAREHICSRLQTFLSRQEEVQKPCRIDINAGAEEFGIAGYCDVIKDDTIWELKIVSELSHTHFLQCAVYMIAFGLPKGILWNVYDNAMYEIRVPDPKAFLKQVIITITKGKITHGKATFGYKFKLEQKKENAKAFIKKR